MTKVMCWLQVVGTLYSHHQKVVIVDTDGPSDRRKLTSFIGGLDLTGGRWDTPSHLLFSSLQNEHKGDFRNKSFTVSFGFCWFTRSRTTMFNMSARFGLAHVSLCTCQSKFLGGSACMLMLNIIWLMEKGKLEEVDRESGVTGWGRGGRAKRTMAWLALQDWWSCCIWCPHQLWAAMEKGHPPTWWWASWYQPHSKDPISFKSSPTWRGPNPKCD
jgi:hypothetical protein